MPSVKKNGKFKFKGFVNLEFTAEQRDAVSEWIGTFDDDVRDCLVVLCECGYKVGFSFDDYHGVLQAALTCKDAGSKYYGYCFTLKHEDPIKLIQVFRWFYDSMLRDEHYSIEETPKGYDW